MQTLTLQQAVGEIVQTVRARHQSPDRAPDPFFLIVGSWICSPSLPTATEMEAGFREKLEKAGVPCPCCLHSPRRATPASSRPPTRKPRTGGSFLEGLLRGKALSAANLRLAHFLGGRDSEGRPHLTHLVVTPNFDDQLSRALRLFGYDAEVIDNPATVDFLDRERTRDVQIVHVHGTYRHYDCRNSAAGDQGQRPLARRHEEVPGAVAGLPSLACGAGLLGLGGRRHHEGPLRASPGAGRSSGLPNKIYWFCYRRESFGRPFPSWLRNDRDVAFVLPEEPSLKRRTAGALARDFSENASRTLPAHRVIGEL